jgi:sugar/nucleoside kinase (ribokinase family)
LAEALPQVPAAYRDSRYIFLANTDPGSQMTLLDSFPDRHLAVADTMDLWINTERDKLLALLKQVDGLLLNDSEAQALTGETNLIRAAEAIQRLGPGFVVIKKGEHGSILHHRDGQVALPAYPARDVIDPTGAGDSFGGAMMGWLAAAMVERQPTLEQLKRALAYGTVAASFNIESFSLERLAQISRSDLDERYRAYQAMLTLI